MQQVIAEMRPAAAMRDSLRVLADPEAEGEEGDWETVAESADEEGEDGGERDAVDEFVAKVSGVEVREVRAARGGGERGRGVGGGEGGEVDAVGFADAAAAAAAAGPVGTDITRPGMISELTAAEAALALTNAQAGTRVAVGDLRHVRGMEALWEGGEKFFWAVGGRGGGRELTVAEAALVLTNMRAGTNVTVEDLRVARVMVDLWDCEDTFLWGVGEGK